MGSHGRRLRISPGMALALALAVAFVVLVALAAFAWGAFYRGTNGDDTITAHRGSATAHLLAGNDTFFGAPARRAGGGDYVRGNEDNDDLNGRSRGDILRGQHGNDRVDGGPGRDGVYGGIGDDTLIGGKGVDLFRPGRGEDTCVSQREDIHPRLCEHVE